jgi:hypothetical protein
MTGRGSQWVKQRHGRARPEEVVESLQEAYDAGRVPRHACAELRNPVAPLRNSLQIIKLARMLTNVERTVPMMERQPDGDSSTTCSMGRISWARSVALYGARRGRAASSGKLRARLPAGQTLSLHIEDDSLVVFAADAFGPGFSTC